jgi:hypothetical protein
MNLPPLQPIQHRPSRPQGQLRPSSRQSVVTSIDGKPGQKEAGLLFEFIKATIEPLNRFLTTDLHSRPLSASRLARFALSERRHIVRAAEWTPNNAAPRRRASC